MKDMKQKDSCLFSVHGPHSTFNRPQSTVKKLRIEESGVRIKRCKVQDWEILNNIKIQISQKNMFGSSGFGILDLFGAWDLVLGICLKELVGKKVEVSLQTSNQEFVLTVIIPVYKERCRRTLINFEFLVP